MQVDVNMVDNQRNVLIKILAISPISTNRRTTSSFAIYLGNKLCHHLVFSCMYLSATRKNNHHILLYCFKYVCILCNIYNINLHPHTVSLLHVLPSVLNKSHFTHIYYQNFSTVLCMYVCILHYLSTILTFTHILYLQYMFSYTCLNISHFTHIYHQIFLHSFMYVCIYITLVINLSTIHINLHLHTVCILRQLSTILTSAYILSLYYMLSHFRLYIITVSPISTVIYFCPVLCLYICILCQFYHINIHLCTCCLSYICSPILFKIHHITHIYHSCINAQFSVYT